MSWTLTHNGQVKSFAAWGMSGVQRHLVSQGMDRVVFEIVTEDMASDTIFSFGDSVTMHRDGIQWFVGTVIQTPLTAAPDSESHGYVIAGPWWHLEENVFKQLWAYPNKYTGHLLLNLNTAGTALASIQQQITNTLQYLLDIYNSQGLGAPYQIGAFSGLDAYPPVNEVNAVSCAAVIRQQLRWAPDTVTWFDYSTSPPTINIKRRANLAPVSVDLNDKSRVSIVPREDLVRPAVHIQYERSSTVDGKQYLQVIDDIFPLAATGVESRAFTVPLSLLGPTINTTFADLLCDTIDADNPDDATRVAWWKKYHEPFADSRYANISIDLTSVVRQSVNGDPSQNYPRMLVEGQIADWMNFNWEQETIKAVVSYDFYDRDPSDPDALKLTTVENQIITIALVSTDAESGSYSNVDQGDPGDPLPVGMAEYFYQGLSVLHYDGDILLVEDEVSGQVGFSNLVNITGGRLEWATMNALPQQIIEEIDSGVTRIIIGPPKHLGPADIMELLRVGRRSRWSPRTAQSSGEIGDAGKTILGKPTANTFSAPGNQNPLLFVVRNGDIKISLDAINQKIQIEDGSTIKVIMDIADLNDVPGASLPAKFRETIICELDGSGNKVEKKSMVLRTDTYD